MTENLDEKGLRSVAENYDFYFIDLWGVIHNGIKLHEKAINVLKKISEIKKDYTLLTNAPRPNNVVKLFLEKMGMEKSMRDKIYTLSNSHPELVKTINEEDIFKLVGMDYLEPENRV